MNASAAVSAPAPWWRAYPEIWRAEIEALTVAGASWGEEPPGAPDGGPTPAVDAPEPLTLRLRWPHPAPQPGDPAALTLLATFAAHHPWFPPRVRLPEPLAGLRRHRNPVDGGLCLLASDDDWRPGTTLAQLLSEQLPRLLAAGRDPGTDAATLALEAGAEAAWTRVRLAWGGLLVDSACAPPAEVPGGWADLVRISGTVAPVSALVTLLDPEHRVLWESRAFGLRQAARVRWARLPGLPPEAADTGELWRRATERLVGLGAEQTRCDEPNAVVVLVPSEGAGRRSCEEWLLLTRGVLRGEGPKAAVAPAEPEDLDGSDQPDGPGQQAPAGEQLALFGDADLPQPPTDTGPADPVADALRVRVRRGYPAGRDDLTARLPGAPGHLAGTTVSVVGVGALGGPLALELARAGVGRLHLVDGDLHDPATGARQLLTIRDAGSPKALALALRILDTNPHVQLTVGLRPLGGDDGTELAGLAASDLVIDGTANQAATRFLAAHLRVSGTPLVIAAATAGGWGGTITTLPSSGGGCWECLQWHRADRTVPWPPARPDGALTPVGCSHPTYVGGWFDLGAIALQATRTALAVLAAGPADTPPAARFGDVQVLTQYRRGRPVHPRWQTRPLAVHPACPLHPPPADRPAAAGHASPGAGADA